MLSERDINAKNNANGARLNNGSEFFIVINTVLLRIAAIHPTSFIMRGTIIGVKF
jgi:hypothetical protein